MSSPNAAPPPPPPPPPFEGSSTPIQNMQSTISKMSSNGDINKQQQSNGILLNGSLNTNSKKSLPPFHDTRNDLMKAIRDGEYYRHLKIILLQ